MFLSLNTMKENKALRPVSPNNIKIQASVSLYKNTNNYIAVTADNDCYLQKKKSRTKPSKLNWYSAIYPPHSAFLSRCSKARGF